MNAEIHTPARLSLLLTGIAVGAAIVFVGTVLLVAERLASKFDSDARRDVQQRVERGLEFMIERLEFSSYDVSEWSAAHEAVHRQDMRWLEVNVGSSAFMGGNIHLVVLGGDPLDGVHGWVASDMWGLGQEDFETLYGFATDLAEAEDMQPLDSALYTFKWLGADLWLIFMGWSVPHTPDVKLTLPTAMMIFGISVEVVKPQNFSDTLLFADVQIAREPGPPGATLELPGVDGPVAWLNWTPPTPGTAAIREAALPVGSALVLVMFVLGLGTVAIRRLAAKLESALSAAEAESRSKSAFLANMSHEIRTPLNGVLGMADLLVDTPLRKQQRDMLATIRESGWALLSLINDILDLSRVESGKISLESRPFALAPLIARLESLHGAAAQAKGIALEIRRDAWIIRHRLGDEVRISQILHNILGNAVKFTQTGSVTLTIGTQQDDVLTFHLRDTGVGMTPEQLARVFEAFEQAEAGTTRRFGGTGLGMSIVRRLIDAMDGEIHVTSTPGIGTEIMISLPVPAMDPVPDLITDLVCEACILQQQQGRLRGLRLLVAEDNATNRKILALMLQKLKIEALFVTNGLEACEAWQREDWDLILLDISMPVMDGLDALRKMQRDSVALGRYLPPAIAATANVMKDQTESYRARGFVDILPKPVRRGELQDVLLRHGLPATAKAATG